LYRGFAAVAAQRGWLRLNLLELDGTLIAGSYDCELAGVGFLLKPAFSEHHRRFSPGIVLLAEVFKARIADGLSGYDFLGDSDSHKLRWTTQVRPRERIWAYRGGARPGYLIRKRVRPWYRLVRDHTGSGG
jgi:CelD/BcsL family acetyltransferase involved in cellulose biosynthesis